MLLANMPRYTAEQVEQAHRGLLVPVRYGYAVADGKHVRLFARTSPIPWTSDAAGANTPIAASVSWKNPQTDLIIERYQHVVGSVLARNPDELLTITAMRSHLDDPTRLDELPYRVLLRDGDRLYRHEDTDDMLIVRGETLMAAVMPASSSRYEVGGIWALRNLLKATRFNALPRYTKEQLMHAQPGTIVSVPHGYAVIQDDTVLLMARTNDYPAGLAPAVQHQCPTLYAPQGGLPPIIGLLKWCQLQIDRYQQERPYVLRTVADIRTRTGKPLGETWLDQKPFRTLVSDDDQLVGVPYGEMNFIAVVHAGTVLAAVRAIGTIKPDGVVFPPYEPLPS